MTSEIHPIYLPFAPEQARQHFLGFDDAGKDPDRHTNAWRRRIDQSPSKDPAFLARDETLWTAASLMAVHYSLDPALAWTDLLTRSLGGDPPIGTSETWKDLMAGDLELYFEVGLRSPNSYKKWLSRHLSERHPLTEQREVSSQRGLSLEGRTHLDALLFNRSKKFAIHLESKVLSDIDTKTKHDALRNQLARNLDCLNDKGGVPALPERDPDRSVLLLLTPRLMQKHWSSRLYGHLFHSYKESPDRLNDDLPHLGLEECESLARRLGWITFEDIRDVEASACPWLERPDQDSNLGPTP